MGRAVLPDPDVVEERADRTGRQLGKQRPRSVENPHFRGGPTGNVYAPGIVDVDAAPVIAGAGATQTSRCC